MKSLREVSSRQRQRGLGLLEIMLITFVLGGVLIAGTIALRAKSPSLAAQNQLQILVEAQKALYSFAVLNNRLPCPDTNRDGIEDCGAMVQKGWFPYQTLKLEGIAKNVGTGQLRYLVQRKAVDLAAAQDVWQPIKSIASGVYSGTRTFTPSNTGIPDLCLKLTNAAATILAVDHAQVAANTARPVAFALVHPGSKDEDGDGDLFDAENASVIGNVVVPAERERKTAVYDDRVVESKYSDFAQQLNCAQLNTSINMVSLGADAVDQVHSQAITNTVLSSVLTVVSSVKAAIAAVKTILAATALATSIGYASTAAGLLSAAISGCVVVIGCAEIPHAVASVAAAAVSVAASSAAVVASAATAVLQVTATGLTLSAAIVAGVSTSSNFDISAAVAQALTEKNKATVNASVAYTNWQNSLNTQNSLQAAYGSARDAIYTVGRDAVTAANKKGVPNGTRDINSLDAFNNSAFAAAYAWYNAEADYANAAEAYSNALNVTNVPATGNADATAALNTIQQQIDAETDPVKKQALVDAKASIVSGITNSSSNTQQVDQINAQIADIDAQIATGPTNVADLQNLRAQLVAQRNGLTPDVATALANKNVADTARATARTNYDNARNALIQASNLPYSIKTCKTSGSPPVESCTTENFNHDARSAMASAVVLAFDDTAVKPNQGVYFQFQRQLALSAAAKTSYDKALETQTLATSAYSSLAAISPGSTGSGVPSTPWNGADAILKEADRRGSFR